MKIKLAVPYRNGGWIIAGCLLMMALLTPLTVTFIREEEYFGAVVCALLAGILLRSAWLRLNYGFCINEKHIVLRSHRKKKVVPYDAVREMIVTFTQESIAACVTTKDGEEIHFVWEEMTIDSKTIFPGRGWGSNSVPICVGIRMTERFVEKSMERLAQCEKVRIENFYPLDQ